MNTNKDCIGVIGAGTMGTGIAQIAATNGHQVILSDIDKDSLHKAEANLSKILSRLIEKERITKDKADDILNNIQFVDLMGSLKDCNFVIEAIVENLDIKIETFARLERIVNEDTILATNTSSLSITSIAAGCKHNSSRVLGAHFFNPAPLMPLVEIIPALQTSQNYVDKANALISSWGKHTVTAKDTPGFIVNKVARPFYGEALRIVEEGKATYAEVDDAMKSIGGFRMGPFELMDLIGNDINYTVTETVFKEFYNEPRFKPSILQKRMVEAKRYGRKTGQGFYNYNDEEQTEKTNHNVDQKEIFYRILVMLINEAVDTVFYNIATIKDIDLAMTKGVNYPKGLLSWADELGLDFVLNKLELLHNYYNEERYHPAPLLKDMVKENKNFYE